MLVRNSLNLAVVKGLLFVALLGLGGFIGDASAQTQSVDINRANFSWAWAQGTGGDASSFTVKCGTTTNTYSMFSIVSDPTLRLLPVKNVIGNNNGNYFCVVSASNSFGESPNSSEIFFAVGAAPLQPSSFGLVIK